MKNLLSDRKIKSLETPVKNKKVTDGDGLYLLLTTSGSKLWRQKYYFAGKEKLASFGAYPDLSLSSARQCRDDLKDMVSQGIDPSEVKKTEVSSASSSSITFREASERHWRQRKDLSDTYMKNAIEGLDRHIMPHLGNQMVDTITKSDVLAPLNKMNNAEIYESLKKCKRWTEAVLDWCVEQELMEVNPTHSIRIKKAFGSAVVQSHRALDIKHVGKFMYDLHEKDERRQPVIATKILVHTWLRTTELRVSRWSQLENGLFVFIPKQRRNRIPRENITPLSTQMQWLFANHKTTARSRGLILTHQKRADRQMSENAVLDLIEELGYHADTTAHGFRTLGSTWAHESGYHEDVIETQLSHRIAGVRGIYNRAKYLKQRKRLLQDWSDFLDTKRKEYELTLKG